MRALKLAVAVTLVAGLAACAQTGGFVRAHWRMVQPAHACADSSFVVYFDEGSDQLSQPARQLIRETTRVYRACNVTKVRVVGLTDATGTPDANLSLSQKRARRVAAELVREHLPSPSFDVVGAGESGAVRNDGREDPMRRRAEVFLTISPR
ncbi:MAG: OmpA family protein [Proteobacteria bacterium]|nr:OmpA family protein [Pseudomonadota bacterium]